MSRVNITSVGELNSKVLDLSLKVNTALDYDIRYVIEVLNIVENYAPGKGFKAQCGDRATSIKNNLQRVLTNMQNSNGNIFDYVSCINQLNINDYDLSAEPVDLYAQYGERYASERAGIEIDRGEEEKGLDTNFNFSAVGLFGTLGAGLGSALLPATGVEAEGEEGEPTPLTSEVPLPAEGEPATDVEPEVDESEEEPEDDGSKNPGADPAAGTPGSSGSSSTGNHSSNKGNSSSKGDNNNNNNSNNDTNKENENNNDQPADSELEQYLDTVPGRELENKGNMSSSSKSLDINLEDNEVSAYTVSILNGTEYNNEGIGMFKDRFVISVSSEYGKIGDFIDIRQSDGTILRCIIGEIQTGESSNNINFIVNQDLFKNSISTLHPNWLQGVTSINNKGNYFDYLNSGLI